MSPGLVLAAGPRGPRNMACVDLLHFRGEAAGSAALECGVEGRVPLPGMREGQPVVALAGESAGAPTRRLLVVGEDALGRLGELTRSSKEQLSRAFPASAEAGGEAGGDNCTIVGLPSVLPARLEQDAGSGTMWVSERERQRLVLNDMFSLQ